MKYVIVFVLVSISTFLIACDSQSPSGLAASRASADSGSINKPIADQQREAWISSAFEVGEVKPASAVGSTRLFTVTAQAHQYADARLTLQLNGVVNLQAEDEVIRTRWRQVGGQTTSILTPTEAQTGVVLPEVHTRQTLEFELVGLSSTGFYAFDSVVVTILPLPAKLSVDVGGIESGEASMVLRLNEPAGQLLTYRYRTLDGTALAGEDFQYQEGEVTFSANSLQQSIPLVVLSNNPAERKVFYLEVSIPGQPESATTYAVTIGSGPTSSKGAFCSTGDSEANAQLVRDFSMLVVDVLGQSLPQTAVEVSSTGAQAEPRAEQYYTDSTGSFVVPCLLVGEYDLALEVGDGIEIVRLAIVPGSQGTQALVSFPVRRLESGELQSLEDQGAVVALSGTVSDAEGAPVVGAQVEVSAGAQTNGAIAVATTDEKGDYTLLLNVGGAVAKSLASSQIRVVASGYRTFVLPNQDLQLVQAWSGLNFILQEQSSSDEVFYSESFDGTSQSGYCGTWRSSPNIDLLSDVDDGVSLWHLHEAGLAIQNRAYLEELVTLAPDDVSAGYVPDPASGSACWYGDQRSDPFTQGNFLGDFDEAVETIERFNGGTSISANSGALVSPWIDLSAAQGPLSLSFLTWWEIEAVNPNDSGYDLMSIEIKDEDGSDWVTLARLNPLSDPVGNDNLDQLPYSNRGFNRAPAWLTQEPIALDAYAGKRIQIRFVFETVDPLYNGFRGWMLDDIKITSTPGTFPLWNAE